MLYVVVAELCWLRLLFANYTASLLAVNSTLLLAGLGAAALLGAVVLALYTLSSASEGGYGQYSQYSQYSRY